MALTGIGDQKTPGRPIEIAIEGETGLPSANQTILLIGHEAATGASASAYFPIVINNVSDVVAASGEVATKFGNGSELAKMVLAAVAANAISGNFPAIKAIPLASGDAGFGAADVALTNASKEMFDFLVSPYDSQNQTLTNKVKNTVSTVSQAQRVENNQFGAFGVAANQNVTDPSLLFKYDSQYLDLVYLRDSAPVYSLGELAAAHAAAQASNQIPFNPLDGRVVGSVPAPVNKADNLTVGAGLESETALNQGYSPLRVKPNGDVAEVRTITTRVTVNGVTATSSYIDVQDWQVLYFWRKTVFTRFSQPDFQQKKASADAAKLIKSEVIRLAKAFEDQGMFQAVDLLAKQFVVQRSLTDRSRFDVLTPVNVIPGLHVIATRVSAGTQFDTLTI